MHPTGKEITLMSEKKNQWNNTLYSKPNKNITTLLQNKQANKNPNKQPPQNFIFLHLPQITQFFSHVIPVSPTSFLTD